MSQFLVQSTFLDHARRCFVIAGDVIEGPVTPYMCMLLPFSSPLGSVLMIEAIEAARKVDGTRALGLYIRYGPDNELQILQSLDLEGRVIEIGNCPTHMRVLGPLRIIISQLLRLLNAG